MGNSIERRTEEKIENLFAVITANPQWNRYNSKIREQFISFRDNYNEKQGVHRSSKQELLKIIDKLNRGNINSESDTYLYETFIKDFVELHRQLVRLETILKSRNSRYNSD